MRKVNVLLYTPTSADLIGFVKANLESKADLQVQGLLDGYSEEEIRQLAAEDISNGVPVELEHEIIFVDHDKLDLLARKKVLELQKQNNDTTLMLCTLPWSQIEDLPNVICPSKMLEALAVSLLPKNGTLGVIQPIAETALEEIKHWQDLGVPVVSAIAAPEDETGAELEAAVESLITRGVDVIVLDCLAFVRDHWQAVRAQSDKSVILPMAVIGKMLDEAYG